MKLRDRDSSGRKIAKKGADRKQEETEKEQKI